MDKKFDLTTPVVDLEDQLLKTSNIDEMNNIIDLFNINIKKKDVIRLNKLNELQDKISKQIEARVDNKIDEFSNKDLLDYFKVIRETSVKSDLDLDTLKMPAIQVNNQYNIVNNDSLDKDSRDRVKSAVDAILARLNKEESQENIVDGSNEET